MEKEFICKTDYFVLLVAPGLSSSSGTSLSSTSPPQDPSSTRAQQLRDHPECFEEFTENLEDTETPVPAHVSQDLDLERPTKVVSKHSFLYSLPKIPKLQSMCANQDDKGSLQKTHW